LLEETVRGALAGRAGDADAVLAEVGWLEMLDAEPDDAIAIVFQALGASNAASSALDDVVARTLGVKPRVDLAVVLPPFGSWEPPGGAGLATARIAVARDVLVCDGRRAAVVPASALDVRRVQGVDPDGGWHTVAGEVDLTAGDDLDPSGWDAAVAHARRALAYEMLGACRPMLALARAHAVERVQFDRPIGSFQAVRHRLAEALVAVESLDATLRAAADEPGATTAALAKATAGRTTHTVARHCQQVLAGIGFTTDHAFHRHLKRTMMLDGLLGSADRITIDLGRQLIAGRRVPTLIEL
jgi:hypothetical protein